MTYTKKITAAGFMAAALFTAAGSAHAEDSASAAASKPAHPGIFSRVMHRPAGSTAKQGDVKNVMERLVLVGKVTAVSGTSLTVASAKDSTAYTVEASQAAIVKGMGKDAKTETLSDIAVGDTIVVSGTANGTAVVATKIMGGLAMPDKLGDFKQRGVEGTVTAVSGSTITVSGHDGKTSYAVDASKASVVKFSGKDMVAADMSSVVVGQRIAVEGTLTGTNVAATKIIVGMKSADGMMPAVMGKVTAVSGAVITVSGKDNISYTVDASAAAFAKRGSKDSETVTIANVAVGDTIAAEGTVSGTSVTATKIMIGMNVPGRQVGGGGSAGLMQKIGGFMAKLKFW